MLKGERILTGTFYPVANNKEPVIYQRENTINPNVALLLAAVYHYLGINDQGQLQLLKRKAGANIDFVVALREPLVRKDGVVILDKEETIRELQKNSGYLLDPNTPWNRQSDGIALAAYTVIWAGLKLSHDLKGTEIMLPPNLQIRMGLNYLAEYDCNSEQGQLNIPFITQIWSPPPEIDKINNLSYSIKPFGSNKWHTYPVLIVR